MDAIPASFSNGRAISVRRRQ